MEPPRIVIAISFFILGVILDESAIRIFTPTPTPPQTVVTQATTQDFYSETYLHHSSEDNSPYNTNYLQSAKPDCPVSSNEVECNFRWLWYVEASQAQTITMLYAKIIDLETRQDKTIHWIDCTTDHPCSQIPDWKERQDKLSH